MRTWGEPRQEEKLHSHVDLVGLLDIVNSEAGSTVAGGRGYYLTREGTLLNHALISFALGFGYKRGYSPVQTPFFMNKDIMAECAQLSDFDEQLYKVSGECVGWLFWFLVCLSGVRGVCTVACRGSLIITTPLSKTRLQNNKKTKKTPKKRRGRRQVPDRDE